MPTERHPRGRFATRRCSASASAPSHCCRWTTLARAVAPKCHSTTRRTGSGISSPSSALSAAPAGFCGSSLFAGTLVRGRAETGNAVPAASLKGALLGLTAASMLGVPSLSPAITLTFWTFAFWYLGLLVGREEEESKTWRLFERRAAGWAFVSAVVVAYAAGTLYVGKHHFSVPRRAQRFGWNYNYGFHALENARAPVQMDGTRRRHGRAGWRPHLRSQDLVRRSGGHAAARAREGLDRRPPGPQRATRASLPD